MEERPGFKRPSVRPLLIGIAAFIVALFAIPYIGLKYVERSGRFPESMPMPPELKKAALLVPMDGLKKEKFASAPSVGQILDLKTLEDHVVAVGDGGAATIDASGKVQKLDVKFPIYVSHAQIAETEANAAPSFLLEGFQGIAFLNSKGQAVSISTESAESFSIGRFSDTGEWRIAAGFPGAGGIYLYALDGKKIWRRDSGNPWGMAFAQIDKGNAWQLINSDAYGRLVVRDKDGKPSQRTMPFYLSRFVPIRWPGPFGKPARRVQKRDDRFVDRSIHWPEPEPALIVNGKGALEIVDYHGKTLVHLASPRPLPNGPDPVKGVTVSPGVVMEPPDETDRWPAAAAYVTLKAGKPPYLAVSAAIVPYQRSTLSLYDETGGLVFCDFLEQDAGPIAVLPAADGSAQRLLLGGNEAVYSYSF